jgi:predicted transcriptional regulator
VDEAVRTVLVAVQDRDWARLKLALHPYLHWTEPGLKLRGRTRVLAHLAGRASISEPASYELRDGQVYRWTTAGED